MIAMKNRNADILSYKTVSPEIIKEIEKALRNSLEYKRFVQFCKYSVKDMDRPVFSIEDEAYTAKNGFHVELHHAPLTLYDICETIVTKHRSTSVGKLFYPLEVAKDVCLAHYELKVGLVPLSRTQHKLVHNGYLKLYPGHIYFKKWTMFIEENNKYLSTRVRENVKKFQNSVDDKAFPEILKYNYNLIDHSIKLNKNTIQKLEATNVQKKTNEKRSS